MKITRYSEIEGNAGSLTIRRDRGGRTIQIDSIIDNPLRDQQRLKRWEISAEASDLELFKIASEAQIRTDGCSGDDRTVHGFYCEILRYRD